MIREPLLECYSGSKLPIYGKSSVAGNPAMESEATRSGYGSLQLGRDLSLIVESCAVLVTVMERKVGEMDLTNPSIYDRGRFVHLNQVFKISPATWTAGQRSAPSSYGVSMINQLFSLHADKSFQLNHDRANRGTSADRYWKRF